MKNIDSIILNSLKLINYDRSKHITEQKLLNISEDYESDYNETEVFYDIDERNRFYEITIFFYKLT